jgi:hypothetical protein
VGGQAMTVWITSGGRIHLLSEVGDTRSAVLIDTSPLLEPDTLSLSVGVVNVGGTSIIGIDLSNSNQFEQPVNLFLFGNLLFSGSAIEVRNLGGQTGFYIRAGAREAAWICRNSTLVTDVDSYWLGPVSDVEYQRSGQAVPGAESFAGENDERIGVAVAWKRRIVPVGGRLSFSFVLRAGQEIALPQLTITVSPLPNPRSDIAFSVSGTSSDPNPNENIAVYVFGDGSIGSALILAPSGPACIFTSSFNVSSVGIRTAGVHNVSFYPINTRGAIGSAVQVPVTVPFRTPTRTQSPRLTRSAEPSATPQRSPFPTRTRLASDPPLPYSMSNVTELASTTVALLLSGEGTIRPPASVYSVIIIPLRNQKFVA